MIKKYPFDKTFLPRTLKRRSQVLGLKVFLGLIHEIERYVNNEAFNQSGKTPHDVIFQDGLFSVLRYKAPADQAAPGVKRKFRVPLVFVPPLMAPGFAYDIYPERSLVRHFLAAGFDVYMMDFGSPDKSHAHLSFEDYILNWMPKAMQAIRKQAGTDDLSMLGYCMGGLFCILYTAVHQDKGVRNIVTVASPIDTHQLGAAGRLLSMIAVPAHKLAQMLKYSVKDMDPKLLHLPGKAGTLFFTLTNPVGTIKSRINLLANLWDRDAVIARESMAHWINNLMDYPGAAIQDIVVQMGLGNTMARKGEFTIGDRTARFRNIESALLAFAGKDDEIIPIESARKIMDIVASDDKTFRIVPGGHVGMIIGHKSPENLWIIATDWLAARSGC